MVFFLPAVGYVWLQGDARFIAKVKVNQPTNPQCEQDFPAFYAISIGYGVLLRFGRAPDASVVVIVFFRNLLTVSRLMDWPNAFSKSILIRSAS